MPAHTTEQLPDHRRRGGIGVEIRARQQLIELQSERDQVGNGKEEWSPPQQPASDSGAPAEARRLRGGSHRFAAHARSRSIATTTSRSGRASALGREQRSINKGLEQGPAGRVKWSQDATVTHHTLVITGRWQTSKEPAYVEASRARNGTS